MVPPEGLPPGSKVGVADAAYIRAIAELKEILYLPLKLPENGDNPQVIFFFSSFILHLLIWLQRDELSATHLVQSYRGLIERMFARLKKWEILSGGSVNSIATKEKELDCAMALQNLIERVRLDIVDGIPARAPFAPNAHNHSGFGAEYEDSGGGTAEFEENAHACTKVSWGARYDCPNTCEGARKRRQ